MKRTLFVLTVLVSLAAHAPADAALITIDLGNPTPGFADGSTPSVLAIGAAQAGSPAPFAGSIGNDLFGPDLSAGWTFSYAAIAETILSATISLGIADHDSAASGDQVASFLLDGVDFTTEMSGAFEASGGGDQEYNVYSFALPAASFLGLADGDALASLALSGPGLQTALIGGGVSETSFNGAFLIHSTLTIETRDPGPGPGPDLPEPATILLVGAGLLGVMRARRSSRIH